MAEFNPSNTIDSQLANLPPEYADKIAKLLRSQQMAQMGMQMGMAGLNAPTQFTGGPANYAVKKSPLATLAQGLQVYLGQKGVSEADAGIAGVKKDAAANFKEQMAGYLSATDPKVQETLANTSQWPQLLADWKERRKQAQETRLAAGKMVGESGDTSGALGIFNGAPLTDYKRPAPKMPEFGVTGPNNTPTVTNYDKYGFPKASLGSGTTISLDQRQASKEGEMALDVLKDELKTRKAQAQLAKESLSANRIALEAINTGAKSGGGEGYKQGLRKALQAFNINLPENTPTTELQMALGNNVLAHARKLAPVTAEDVVRLEQILGSINTDPAALQKMIAVYNGIALKDLQDFNKYVTHQQGNLKSDYARDLFSGAGIGFEMQPPPGDVQQMLRAIAELQKRGGDVSQFAVGGEQIPPDATFKLGASIGSPSGGPITLDEYLRRQKGK